MRRTISNNFMPQTQILCHSHTFRISANMGYFGVMGRALLTSPKGQNASRDGVIKLVVAVCLLKFAYYFKTYYAVGL